MCLSNTKIWECLDAGAFSITPAPPRTIDGTNPGYDSDSVNLTLGNVIQIPKPGVTFDPTSQLFKEVLAANCETLTLGENDKFELKPGMFVLAQTEQVIHFPAAEGAKPAYFGRVFGRSTLARCGVTSASYDAPVVHNGTQQKITLELSNVGGWTIVLRPKMIMCQLQISQLDGVPQTRLGQYHKQDLPSGEAAPTTAK